MEEAVPDLSDPGRASLTDVLEDEAEIAGAQWGPKEQQPQDQERVRLRDEDPGETSAHRPQRVQARKRVQVFLGGLRARRKSHREHRLREIAPCVPFAA